MSGRYMRLRPGRYLLTVGDGEGPAGIRRTSGRHVQVDRDGGRVPFRVPAEERVYFWWRGPSERPAVRIESPARETPPDSDGYRMA